MPGPSSETGWLWGMVRNSDLQQAAASGTPDKKLADIFGENSRSGHSTAEELPHVHPDHGLGLALERMGTSGLNVLPVVSRANVRELIGIVVLDDILEAYGVAKRANLEEPGE